MKNLILLFLLSAQAMAANSAIDGLLVGSSSGRVGALKVTSCAAFWTRQNTSFGSFGTQSSCSYAVENNVSAPATNIPAIKITSVSANTCYVVKLSGSFYRNTSGDAWLRITDGTNNSTEQYINNWSSDSAVGFPSIQFTLCYGSSPPGGSVTFEFQAKTGASTSANIGNDSSIPAYIELFKFPVVSP